MNIRFSDGSRVDVIDADCEFRPCFTFGFDKGPFTQGVGYTRPETPQQPVCNTRHLHGCPHVGAHIKCGNCQAILGLVMEGEERELPPRCPQCSSTDLYWLSDVLEEPRPCCSTPSVARNPKAYSQRCRSCGSTLRGKRLELARSAG